MSLRHYTTKKKHMTAYEEGWLLDSIIKSEGMEAKALPHGENLMHVAAKEGAYDVLESLIRVGYNVESEDNYGHTPLFYAVENSLMDVCDLLLNAGADVNHSDMNFNTPLIKAVVNKDFAMVKYLVSNGADINQYNFYGETPLKIACQEASEHNELQHTEEFQTMMAMVRYLIKMGGVLDDE